MDISALLVVVLGAVIALYLQRQMAVRQYTASPAAADQAAPLAILFSRRVVTPHGVLAAAVHVAGGRIQAIVPCDSPPRNTAVTDYSDLVISPGQGQANTPRHDIDTHLHRTFVS